MNLAPNSDASKTRVDTALGPIKSDVDLEALKDRFDQAEPLVQAFVPENDRFKRLRQEHEAHTASTHLAAPSDLFVGLPVGVKDIFQVDGFETRGGSTLPPSLLRETEGRAVRRLREAGVLFVGKTVTTEFAYFGPGPTRNPANLSHSPGGSSSGSAAAVAAGLCALSLGTQTIGSVIRPAAFCGIYGYKPSYGRIPTSGVIPLSPAYDHVGIFTRDIPLMQAASKLLVAGWKSGPAPDAPVLGIPTGPYLDNATPDGLENFERIVDLLGQSGLDFRRVPVFANYEEIIQRHYLVVAAEAAQVHKSWFAAHQDRYHPKTAELILAGQKISREELVLARSQRSVPRDYLADLMQEQGIDLWVAPFGPGIAPEGLESTGNPVMNLPWTQAGLPAFNIPSGRSPDNLPFGLQVVAPFGKDEILLHHVHTLAGRIKPD